MPWTVQTVQAVVFTSEQPSAYDLFEPAFGYRAANFQNAPPPMIGTMAASVADHRQYTVQVTPGRIDVSISPIAAANDPAIFVPLPAADLAKEQLATAIATIATRCATVGRLAWVVRSVLRTDTANEATNLFADYVGLPADRIGTLDNILQTNRQTAMPGLQDALLNRLIVWRTEMMQMIDVNTGFGGQPTITQRDHYAISLNVDLNVIPRSGTLPTARVGELVHELAQLSVEFAAINAPRVTV